MNSMLFFCTISEDKATGAGGISSKESEVAVGVSQCVLTHHENAGVKSFRNSRLDVVKCYNEQTLPCTVGTASIFQFKFFVLGSGTNSLVLWFSFLECQSVSNSVVKGCFADWNARLCTYRMQESHQSAMAKMGTKNGCVILAELYKYIYDPCKACQWAFAGRQMISHVFLDKRATT